MKRMKLLVCIMVMVLCLLCVDAMAATWTGGHNLSNEKLAISVGDILDRGFGMHGNIYLSGDYSCRNWADWAVGWGTSHGVYEVTSFSQNGTTVNMGVKKIFLDGYDNDSCDYSDAKYTWVDDQCTVEGVCKRNGDHKVNETVTGIYQKDTDATCTAAETGHYEATFTNQALEKQQSAPFSVGDPLGHDWDAPSYTWDGDQCTAERVCKNDGEHKETETVTAIYVKDTDVTCLAAETGHYEAVFTNSAFEKQQTATSEVGEPLGHDWDAPSYTWDGDQCTAERVCKNDGEHKETETVTGVYVKETDNTCTEPETGHYEAEFANPVFEKQQSETFDVGGSRGHVWGEWKLIARPTEENEGWEAVYCDICGELLDGRRVFFEKPADETVSYLSVDGVAVCQILERVSAQEDSADTLVIRIDPEESLVETKELTFTFTAQDLEKLAADGCGSITLTSACGAVEIPVAVSDLQAMLTSAGADRIVLSITDVAALPENWEQQLPAGTIVWSAPHNVAVKVYSGDELQEADPALFTAICLRMPGIAPLTNANNDRIGLFMAETEGFTVLTAEYIYDEAGIAAGQEIWQIPFTGNGVYLTVEKMPE